MIIRQFDTDPQLRLMAEKHHAWHTGGAHGQPGRQIPAGNAGSGNEFILFHRNLVSEFFAWNAAHGNVVPPALLAAWTGVPTFLKSAAHGWTSALATAEQRILNDHASFADLDAYGQFIESTIHNWIHGATAHWLNSDADMANDDPFIGTLHSPQSTYFYQIQGLVDLWARNFRRTKNVRSEGPFEKIADQKNIIKERIKDVIKERLKDNIKERIKDVIKEHIKEDIKDRKEFKEDFKEHIKEGIKERKEFKEDFKEHIKEDIKERKEFKEKDKDLIEDFEVGDFGGLVDPPIDHVTREMMDRLSKLEARAEKGKAFIRPDERPNVGRKRS